MNNINMAEDVIQHYGTVDNSSSQYGGYLVNESHVDASNYTGDNVENMLQELIEASSKVFDQTTETIFIICYTMMILFGALGNGLVSYVVVKNAHMRTPRNIFIINLAVSDLTLCLFTQPLNLYRLLRYQWLFGAFMCKFVGMCQGTNVFVSTISITAIALDRFQVIVYPTKDSMKKFGAAAALISIWIISFLMSSPLLLFSVYKTVQIIPPYQHYYYRCIEDIDLSEAKGAYSVASMVVQYILPIFIVIIAHAQICNKLKYRMVNQSTAAANRTNFQKRKNERQSRRKRRTNILLSMIAVVFALSWLPLNVFNILTEFHSNDFKILNINLIYVICHMMVLSSACLNPVLYGWLNENFRNEFMKVLPCGMCSKFATLCKTKCCRCCANTNGDVPVIVFTKDNQENSNVNGGNCTTFDGCSVTGLHSVTEVNSHRSQVSL